MQEWDAKMSTRASAKQEEPEEQMAKLVSMIELQQQRQAQFAREQQQRQEDQFGHLLEEQQQQGKLLMKQQREAEEQIGALQDDLRQTKEAMEGWLQATEEFAGRDAPRINRKVGSGSGVSVGRATGGVAD